MVITFKSKASGDVIMFGDVAKQMLRIMGKRDEVPGIITVEQLPDALARLKAEVAAERASLGGGITAEEDAAQDEGARERVSLSQRAVPLIDLLERSLTESTPVLWDAGT